MLVSKATCKLTGASQNGERWLLRSTQMLTGLSRLTLPLSQRIVSYHTLIGEIHLSFASSLRAPATAPLIRLGSSMLHTQI